jgi:hypothetical protein
MQIFMNLPKLVSPQFLFTQEVNHPIEISKITKIDRLSDVGLAIRNPVALRKGLPGLFYLQLPNEKTRLELRGKVLRSEPHPEYPGQYLIYFSYFGINKASLSQVRRALMKAPQYKALLNENRDAFHYNPDSLFKEASDDTVFGIAVVDSDDLTGNALADQIKKEMDRVHTIVESSYQLFLHKYFDARGKKRDSTPPNITEEKDFYRIPISLSISVADLKCLSVDPGPGNEDTFLGHPAAALFGTPDGWLGIFDDQESKLIMEEAAQLVLKGRVLQKLLTVKDFAGERRALNFKIFRGATEQIMTIEITPANFDDIMARYSADQKEHKIHAVIADTSFVPEDAKAWVDGLRARATQVGLTEGNDQLRFFLLQENENRYNEQWLNTPEILGLLPKPVDYRQMLFLMAEYLPNKDTPFQFPNIGWSQPALNVHVAKSVDLEALSEFGATLRSKQKLVPGTMIYLRKSIYDNAPNGCLAARVYACLEHPKEKGFFQIFTTYFGINDAFLKFARTWIRENYAHQKKTEG